MRIIQTRIDFENPLEVYYEDGEGVPKPLDGSRFVGIYEVNYLGLFHTKSNMMIVPASSLTVSTAFIPPLVSTYETVVFRTIPNGEFEPSAPLHALDEIEVSRIHPDIFSHTKEEAISKNLDLAQKIQKIFADRNPEIISTYHYQN